MTWCILRTSGGRTLSLARSLTAAGFGVWTPVATRRLPLRRDGRIREQDMPILPTFVFADQSHVIDLAHASMAPDTPHPAFSLFRRGNRVPLIGEREIIGLRQAEVEAQAKIDGLRDEDARLAMRKERAERLRTEKAKRKALRAQVITMEPGTFVTVADAPALAGMVGQVVEVRGKGTAAVVAFGGSLVMEIEAWQLLPDVVANQSLVSHDRHGAVR